MKIAVMGAGGVGGYFGGRLAANGEDVHFVARGQQLWAMREQGLQVRSSRGDFVVARVSATDQPESIGPVDVVMFCVKCWDTAAAADLIRPLIGEETAVISFQNGVDNEERIAAVLGSEHVVGGTAYIFANIARPGEIEHQGTTARLVFGELSGGSSPRLEALQNACRGAAIDADVVDDVVKEIWTKFLFICATSGVASLVRLAIGPIRHDPDTRGLIVDVLREAEAVARARGVKLDPDIVQQDVAFLDTLAPDLRPSMLKDLEAGSRLELDWLNGAVARMAREQGVDAPVNRLIYTALKLHARPR